MSVTRIGMPPRLCNHPMHFESNNAIEYGEGIWQFVCPGCGEVKVMTVTESEVRNRYSGPRLSGNFAAV